MWTASPLSVSCSLLDISVDLGAMIPLRYATTSRN
jgi:hypothetical protein